MCVTSWCRKALSLGVLLLTVGVSGCSAVARQAIPAYCVTPSLPETPRGSKEPINFIRLRQDPPPVYLVGPRDVLGIYIEGVLGKRDEPPPVHFPEREAENIPPAIGFPIPVREDGTISLPLIAPLRVAGLTLAQVEEEIRLSYVVRQRILQPNAERILVTLVRPRTYAVLVIREDTSLIEGGTTLGGRTQGRLGQATLGTTRFGATHLVELPAYQNDVLHALSKGGGLPGLDAENEILILRGGFQNAEQRDRLLGTTRDRDAWRAIWENNPNVMRIPLRVGPDDPPLRLTPNDIILNTGDIVYVRSRQAEVFYTGGLLPGGQFPIPRDYDLDVLGAMAMAGGSVATAPGTAGNTLTGGNRGVGGLFPPTRVIVLRTVNGQQVAIKLDLKRAMLNPRERLLVQPNDYILLEYTEMELFLNMLLGNVQFNYFLNNIGR